MAESNIVGAVAAIYITATEIQCILSQSDWLPKPAHQTPARRDFYINLRLQASQFENWCECVGIDKTYVRQFGSVWPVCGKTLVGYQAPLQKMLKLKLGLSKQLARTMTLTVLRDLQDNFVNAWTILQTHQEQQAWSRMSISSDVSGATTDSESDYEEKPTLLKTSEKRNRSFLLTRISTAIGSVTRSPGPACRSAISRLRRATIQSDRPGPLEKRVLRTLLDDIGRLNELLLVVLRSELVDQIGKNKFFVRGSYYYYPGLSISGASNTVMQTCTGIGEENKTDRLHSARKE